MSAVHRTTVAAAISVIFIVIFTCSIAEAWNFFRPQAVHHTNSAPAFHQDFLGPLTTCKDLPLDFCSLSVLLPGTHVSVLRISLQPWRKGIANSARKRQKGTWLPKATRHCEDRPSCPNPSHLLTAELSQLSLGSTSLINAQLPLNLFPC